MLHVLGSLWVLTQLMFSFTYAACPAYMSELCLICTCLLSLNAFVWLCTHRWVVTGATGLATQVQRLLAGESWQPLSSKQKVAGSAVELQRLLNVSELAG